MRLVMSVCVVKYTNRLQCRLVPPARTPPGALLYIFSALTELPPSCHAQEGQREAPCCLAYPALYVLRSSGIPCTSASPVLEEGTVRGGGHVCAKVALVGLVCVRNSGVTVRGQGASMGTMVIMQCHIHVSGYYYRAATWTVDPL